MGVLGWGVHFDTGDQFIISVIHVTLVIDECCVCSVEACMCMCTFASHCLFF